MRMDVDVSTFVSVWVWGYILKVCEFTSGIWLSMFIKNISSQTLYQ